MMYGYGYGGWPPYVSVAERRMKAKREIAALRKRGRQIAPVEIAGRTITATFWGKSWCDNLESYRDYENRLPRGRSYVRGGMVADLQIAPSQIDALVCGSSLYKVSIAINALPPAQWRAICRDCTGGIDSLVELLQGRFSKNVMERLCRQDGGLFPKPSEIKFSCSCPDSAILCKHVAATLYGVGARLDDMPELLFRLRAVSETDLLAGAGKSLPGSTAAPAADKVLETEDVSALFGLDMAASADPADAARRVAVRRGKRARNKEQPREFDATDAPWQAFEQAPSLELYRKLKSSASRTDAARDRALTMLRKAIGRRQPMAERAMRVDLYIRLAMTEGQIAEAWKTVRKHGCGDELLAALAKASEKPHPAEALKAYAQLVEQLIGSGGRGNYASAGKIVGRMARIRKHIGKGAEHAAYIDGLTNRHKAKRNFIKLLPK